MQIIDGIPVWGDPDLETVAQMKRAMQYGGEYCALMADHHLGYSVPVGGVIAYEGRICVNGVGYDIGCGNKAVRLDVSRADIQEKIVQIMDEIKSKISFGVGGTNNETVDHELFEAPEWTEIKFLGSLKDKARSQLGTVGSGNHYVDIFADELDRIWVGVHFGSRGLGHNIATKFITDAGGKDGINAEPVLLNEDTDIARSYINCMELAGKYAYAGRDWVCDRVAKIIGGNIVEQVHNHHNFAWRERHFGKDLWVVRKGATPAYPGQKSFVGGSMGEISAIVEGLLPNDGYSKHLNSTIHGAGRVLGRTQARGKRSKNGTVIKEGRVSHEAMREWVKRSGVVLRGGDVDEAPQCYKRITDVLGSHKDTIRIVNTLHPLGVCMDSRR